MQLSFDLQQVTTKYQVPKKETLQFHKHFASEQNLPNHNHEQDHIFRKAIYIFQEKDGKLVSGDKGRVLDPDNGKFYYGKIWLEDGKLILRGSLDKKGILGRSQTWIRKK